MAIHDLTVQEALNVQLGQGGAIVIDDTNPHYGDYAEVYALEASEFTAALADSLFGNGIAFEAGKSYLVSGARCLGGTSGSIFDVKEVTVDSGTLAGGDGVGWIKFHIHNGIAPVATESIDLIDHNGTVMTSAIMTVRSAANGGNCVGGTFAGVVLAAGQSIKGPFEKIILASGKVLAYKK